VCVRNELFDSVSDDSGLFLEAVLGIAPREVGALSGSA
jgi:hypothetical protein